MTGTPPPHLLDMTGPPPPFLGMTEPFFSLCVLCFCLTARLAGVEIREKIVGQTQHLRCPPEFNQF